MFQTESRMSSTTRENTVTQDKHDATDQSTNGATTKAHQKKRLELANKQALPEPVAIAETTQLLHELLLHQIEVEAQRTEYKEGLQTEVQTQLAATLARYTDLYNFAPVGYFTLARDSTILQSNLTGAFHLGSEQSKLPGTRFGLFVAETDLTILTACIEQVFSTNTKQTCELTLARSDQSALTVQFAAMPSTEKQECRAVTLDISLRKQTANTLESSLKHIRLIQDAINAHSLVAITDWRGKIIYTNEKFCAISQYTHKELIGQNHRILNSSFHPREFFQDLWTTIKRRYIWKGEIKNLAKDGSFYWLDTTIVPFIDAAGKPYQYVAIHTEITQRKQLEQLMEQQIEEFTRSNAELAQFAYVATHDLQEPLRAVTSCVQLLGKYYQGKLDARADEYIAHAIDGAKRMHVLINDLLTYSQINATHSQVPVDCSALLNNLLISLKPAITESSAVITHELLPTVTGIPSQLTQLLQNLISNALKFHGKDAPKIHISAERTAGAWLFSITDNGIGIEQQYYERIFRVFQRLHTRKEFPGTGIGLAICKKVVEQHGGRIWAESRPEQGTTFFFTIAENS